MVTWEKVELGKQADIWRGGSPRPIQSYLTQRNDGINWIKIGDVAPNAKHIDATDERITPEGATYSRAVGIGDFLLSNSMSFGRPYILRIDGCIHDGWLTIQNYQKNFDTDFLYYVLGSGDTLQQYVTMAAGSSVQNLSKEKVSSIIICKPPLPEQRRIAEALSDMDSLLTAMEKLIAKKCAIKQGTMQELLTGKRRLSGFEGKFVNMNLVNNSTLKARIGWQGLTTAEYLDSGYSYLITGTDFFNGKIAWNTCCYVDKYRYDQDPNIQIVNGDVLITKDGTIGKIAIVDGLSKNATLNSGVFVIRPKGGAYNHRYVYYVLLSQIFLDFLDKLAAGSTINHLYQKDFVNFEFDVPPTLAEQTAIAEILSDMDAEIDVLTTKLNKLRAIKQGMMSELLTGRIRLTEQQAEAVPAKKSGHNQQFDDAVMIAGIVNVLYSDTYPLGRKKVQKCLYLLRRYQNESTAAFKKKAAGPYADEVRYKGGEPIAQSAKYITRTDTRGKGTTFARGEKISQALDYIQSWGKQTDIKWVADKLKFKKVDELELLATVDMAICDLTEAGIPVSVASIKHLIASNEEWKAKLEKQTFSDTKINYAIQKLRTLFSGGITL